MTKYHKQGSPENQQFLVSQSGVQKSQIYMLARAVLPLKTLPLSSLPGDLGLWQHNSSLHNICSLCANILWMRALVILN